MKGRSKRGKIRGLTKNQSRKAAYAATAAADREARRQTGMVASTTKQIHTHVHRRPCGNPACRGCYTRLVGQGIYVRLNFANPFPVV